MRDPQMRQAMMRNADRAMANLETVPGGPRQRKGGRSYSAVSM